MMRRLLALAILVGFSGSLIAQQPPKNRPPSVTSPEVKDKSVAFRIYAPKAEKVGLSSSDIPGGGQAPRALAKAENGVWELKLDVAPGTYRYVFDVDGVRVLDSRNQSVSESNGTVWSLVRVAGAAFMDTAEVPHGSVSRITYHSKSLGKQRRAHVYTPPGYETSNETYPVFYLLHGAGDCDDSWTSVGRAHDILDNLIAAKKAKPMVVVMPAGHIGPFAFGVPQPARDANAPPPARFEDDFEKDLRPLVEKSYRVKSDRANRAVAGLSMGGGQTLSLFVSKPTDYAYVGVFSSGVFAKSDAWEKQNEQSLKAGTSRDGLKLLWFATGKDDFLLERTRETVGLFKKHEFKPVYEETDGGHTWIKWQQYLHEFAPKLFQSS